MTKRTCHFSDGCVWPEQYGGPFCTCRTAKLADFWEKPVTRTERAWGMVAIVWVPILILAGLILWANLQ